MYYYLYLYIICIEFVLLCFIGFFVLGDRRCGHPAVPPNAKVSLASDTDIVPGTVATYECDDGYELFGAHQRECTLRGDWTSEPPFCGKPRTYNVFKCRMEVITNTFIDQIYLMIF